MLTVDKSIMERWELNKWILCVLIVSLVILINVPRVYAQDEGEVDLTDLPSNLAKALGVSEAVAKLLASACVMLLFLTPVLMLTRNLYAILMIGFIAMGILIALGWLDFWFILAISLIIASLWGSKIAKAISGGRE